MSQSSSYQLETNIAIEAAKKAGELLKKSFGTSLTVDESTMHDIKLALDKQSQHLIEDTILTHFPSHQIIGEEGNAGSESSDYQWIIDPIDGTVNLFYHIPHFCVSIALRYQQEIVLGVIYDPCVDELWVAQKGQGATCNNVPIQCSQRSKLEDSILFVGCGKTSEALDIGLARFRRAALRAKKMRMMGSAALGLAYIASGRLDAYVEMSISLWDIAAGKLLVEEAGGSFEMTDNGNQTLAVVAYNGKIPIHDIL